MTACFPHAFENHSPRKVRLGHEAGNRINGAYLFDLLRCVENLFIRHIRPCCRSLNCSLCYQFAVLTGTTNKPIVRPQHCTFDLKLKRIPGSALCPKRGTCQSQGPWGCGLNLFRTPKMVRRIGGGQMNGKLFSANE